MSDDDFNWRDSFALEEDDPIGPNAYWGSDHLSQAVTLYERGDFKRALAKAVKAVEAWPTHWQSYVIAGDCIGFLCTPKERLT